MQACDFCAAILFIMSPILFFNIILVSLLFSETLASFSSSLQGPLYSFCHGPGIHFASPNMRLHQNVCLLNNQSLLVNAHKSHGLPVRQDLILWNATAFRNPTHDLINHIIPFSTFLSTCVRPHKNDVTDIVLYFTSADDYAKAKNSIKNDPCHQGGPWGICAMMRISRLISYNMDSSIPNKVANGSFVHPHTQNACYKNAWSIHSRYNNLFRIDRSYSNGWNGYAPVWPYKGSTVDDKLQLVPAKGFQYQEKRILNNTRSEFNQLLRSAPLYVIQDAIELIRQSVFDPTVSNLSNFCPYKIDKRPALQILGEKYIRVKNGQGSIKILIFSRFSKSQRRRWINPEDTVSYIQAQDPNNFFQITLIHAFNEPDPESAVYITHESQARLFCEADIIVGPHGGQNANLVYSNNVLFLEVLARCMHGPRDEDWTSWLNKAMFHERKYVPCALVERGGENAHPEKFNDPMTSDRWVDPQHVYRLIMKVLEQH